MDVFDSISPDYEKILDQSIRTSGETSEYFADYKAQCVVRSLGSEFQGTILDYGCGVGMVIKALKKRVNPNQVRLTGFDSSAETIKRCRSEIIGVDFLNQRAELEGKNFDALIISNVLHHVDVEKRVGFLKGAIQLLKLGGILFVFEHNSLNPLTQWVVHQCPFDKGVKLLSAWELRDMLRDLNMKDVKTKYITFFPKALSFLRAFEPCLVQLPIGAQLFVSANKRP